MCETMGQYGHLRVLRAGERAEEGGQHTSLISSFYALCLARPQSGQDAGEEGREDESDARCPPREPLQALARDDVPTRQEHGRVLRRALLLRNRARKDRVEPVGERERDLDLRTREREEGRREGQHWTTVVY